MSSLRLLITTPSAILVDSDDAGSVRAEDASGGFGLLPGHADLLTVLTDCVVRWRDGSGRESYCAVRSGVLTVTGGARVEIACRQGLTGDDLTELRGRIARMREQETDAGRRLKVEQTRLHARAVRQLMRYLRPAAGAAPATPERES